MTFNEVLGLVVVLEDLGFEVTEAGFSYKAGPCVWHRYVDIKMSDDWSEAYVSYDKYSWDGDETEIASKVYYTLPIEYLIKVLTEEFGFTSRKENERKMAELRARRGL